MVMFSVEDLLIDTPFQAVEKSIENAAVIASS
jgi:hypothetical protein